MVKCLPYIYIHDISNVHDISKVILSIKKRFGQIILILLHHTFYIILLHMYHNSYVKQTQLCH